MTGPDQAPHTPPTPDPVDGAPQAPEAGQATGSTRRPRVGWLVRRLASWTGLVVVAVTGLTAGVLLLGHQQADIGPFQVDLALSPSISGDTEVAIPPLGSLHLDSHDGPAHLSARLEALDQARTQALITSPDGIRGASRTAAADLETGVIRLALRTVGVGVLAAMVLAALVYRKAARVAWAGGIALVAMAVSIIAAAQTFSPSSVREPRYEGLLANAPAVVGDAERIADRYDAYSAQLQRLVANVGTLYGTVANLPVYEPDDNTIRILHVSDLHLNPAAWPVMRTAVENFHIDAVVDTGDIVDWGSPPESNYVNSIPSLKVPYIFIRGNHDSGRTEAAVAAQKNAVVLDGDVTEVRGLTIAGIGDPRFTPDKQTSPAGSNDLPETIDRVTGSGRELADVIDAYGSPVDVALVHDPASAQPLADHVPLVLAGHRHARDVSVLPGSTTRMMVEGSTGGAGLRGLEGEQPVSLEMSVLYFDHDHELTAYDEITVGGTGLAQVSLARHIADPILVPAPEPSEGGAAPQSPPGPAPTSPGVPPSTEPESPAASPTTG